MSGAASHIDCTSCVKNRLDLKHTLDASLLGLRVCQLLLDAHHVPQGPLLCLSVFFVVTGRHCDIALITKGLFALAPLPAHLWNIQTIFQISSQPNLFAFILILHTHSSYPLPYYHSVLQMSCFYWEAAKLTARRPRDTL